MRITPKTVTQVSSETPKAPRQTPRGSGPIGGQASVVALSTAGAAVVKDAAEPAPASDARIEKLRAAVEAGTYKVDLHTLASRIVDDEVVRGGKQ